MPSHRSGNYRLSSASHSRRRLLLARSARNAEAPIDEAIPESAEWDVLEDAAENHTEMADDVASESVVREALVETFPAETVPEVAIMRMKSSKPIAAPRPRLAHDLRDEPGLRRIRRLLDGGTPVTWVFTGDESTQGGAQTAKRRTFSEMFAERVRGELRRYLDVVINTGIAGDRAEMLAKNLEHRVLRFRPDVVSITLGLNDAARGPAGRAEFGDHLAELLAEVRAEGAVPLLHVPTRFSIARSAAHADLPAYIELLRSAAKESEAPLLDHWTDWKSHRQSRAWLAEDQIHPNAYGHRAMARLMFAALDIFDEKSPCCG